MVTFPDQCELPDRDEDLGCSSSTAEYFHQLICARHETIENAVLVQISLSKDIPALETFKFAINNIMNPNSTKPSDKIKVQIFETDQLLSVTNEDAGSLIVITSVPCTVRKDQASIQPSVRGAGLASVYTLKMSLEHSLAKGGGLLIRYPP